MGLTYNNIPEYVTYYECQAAYNDPSEDYFVRNEPEVDDLQVLTINDYTFVTNRKVPVQMTQSDSNKRSPEATVELRSIAGLTTYTLEFFEPENEITKATELTVAGTGFDTDSDQCVNDVDAEFSQDGIRFRIKTSSVKVP